MWLKNRGPDENASITILRIPPENKVFIIFAYIFQMEHYLFIYYVYILYILAHYLGHVIL